MLTGTPKEGYVYTAIRYSPETVRVKGTGAVLNTINTIEIPAGIVDIEGESETIVQTVDVSTYLPDGITLVDDEDKKITVTVEIEQIGTRMLELPTKNITIHNIPEGYRAEFVDETVKVYIRGLDADLEKLSPEDVTATVDVGGRSQGEFTVVINLELDEELYSTNGTQTAMIRLISRNALEDGDEESNGTGDGTDDDDNKKDTENNTGGALNKPENGSNEDTDTGN